jgi:hypothetical protein
MMPPFMSRHRNGRTEKRRAATQNEGIGRESLHDFEGKLITGKGKLPDGLLINVLLDCGGLI